MCHCHGWFHHGQRRQKRVFCSNRCKMLSRNLGGLELHTYRQWIPGSREPGSSRRLEGDCIRQSRLFRTGKNRKLFFSHIFVEIIVMVVAFCWSISLIAFADRCRFCWSISLIDFAELGSPRWSKTPLSTDGINSFLMKWEVTLSCLFLWNGEYHWDCETSC